LSLCEQAHAEKNLVKLGVLTKRLGAKAAESKDASTTHYFLASLSWLKSLGENPEIVDSLVTGFVESLRRNVRTIPKGSPRHQHAVHDLFRTIPKLGSKASDKIDAYKDIAHFSNDAESEMAIRSILKNVDSLPTPKARIEALKFSSLYAPNQSLRHEVRRMIALRVPMLDSARDRIELSLYLAERILPGELIERPAVEAFETAILKEKNLREAKGSLIACSHVAPKNGLFDKKTAELFISLMLPAMDLEAKLSDLRNGGRRAKYGSLLDLACATKFDALVVQNFKPTARIAEYVKGATAPFQPANPLNFKSALHTVSIQGIFNNIDAVRIEEDRINALVTAYRFAPTKDLKDRAETLMLDGTMPFFSLWPKHAESKKNHKHNVGHVASTDHEMKRPHRRHLSIYKHHWPRPSAPALPA